MKFIKGMVIGGLITTGIVMMYAEGTGMMNKKKKIKGQGSYLLPAHRFPAVLLLLSGHHSNPSAADTTAGQNNRPAHRAGRSIVLRRYALLCRCPGRGTPRGLMAGLPVA